jgi:hypothetical protein
MNKLPVIAALVSVVLLGGACTKSTPPADKPSGISPSATPPPPSAAYNY